MSFLCTVAETEELGHLKPQRGEERSQLRCFRPLIRCLRRVHPRGDHEADLRHVGEVVSVGWPGNATCLGLTA